MCEYDAISSDDLLYHLRSVHRIDETNYPPNLSYLFEKGTGGFFEAKNPIIGKAPIHQQNALRAKIPELYNPSFKHSSIIPVEVPPPWVQLSKDNYAIPEKIIKDTEDEKIYISAQLNPGHGILSIKRISIERREPNLISKIISGSNEVNIVPHEEIIDSLNEYFPFSESREYINWKVTFLKKAADRLEEITRILNQEYNESI